MRKLYLLAVAGVLVGGAFWFGRSSETAQARPETSSEAVATKPPLSPQRTPTIPRVAPVPALRRSEPAPGLAADLAAADPKIRRAAIKEAVQSDVDPQLLLTAAKDSDVDVGLGAVAGLAQLYREGRISTEDMAKRALDRNTSPRVRTAALNAFGAVPSTDAAALLVKLLETGDEIERRSAAALLGNQDPILAVPALIQALADADEYVRIHALESLRLRSRGRDFGMDAAGWQAWWQSTR